MDWVPEAVGQLLGVLHFIIEASLSILFRTLALDCLYTWNATRQAVDRASAALVNLITKVQNTVTGFTLPSLLHPFNAMWPTSQAHSYTDLLGK